MLIEFKVANFRSIRDLQTLSLVAMNADKVLRQNLVDVRLPGLSSLRFLKGAALYGANASGKTNLLEALYFVASLVEKSASRFAPGQSIPVQPFKLDAASHDAPSQFEVTCTADGVRYVYGFSVSRERVLEEYLDAYPKGLPQHWYHRRWNGDAAAYEWSRSETHFKVSVDLQERTRDNALFLSVAAMFNADQVLPLHDWFRRSLRFVSLGAGASSDPSTTMQMHERAEYRDRIVRFLSNADTGIVSMISTPRDVDTRDASPWLLREQLRSYASAQDTVTSRLRELDIALAHRAAGEDPIPLAFPAEESAGTVRFLSLIGPWLDMLDNGYTVCVDEIDTSMHPLLVRELLRLVFSDSHNTNGAQIIFTTHNPLLLDATLMRRDQIWFTEKTPQGATKVYPLTEYKPRKDEALARGYLAGRYGGIPFIPEGLIP